MDQLVDNGVGEQTSTLVRALTRVAKHHGINADATQLLRSDPFNGAEPSTPRLIAMARRLGLTAQHIRVKSGDLQSLARLTPAILLHADGRGSLLTAVREQNGAWFALVEDLVGDHELTALIDQPRLFAAWNGDLVLVKRAWRLTDEQQPFGIAWLVGQVVKERRLFRDIGVAAVMVSILALVPAMAFMILMDRVLSNHSYPTLAVLGIGVAIVTIFDTLFGYLRRHLTIQASSRIDARINLHIYDKLLDLPMSFFERMATGTINSKIAQIWHIRHFLTGTVFGTLLDSITLLVLMPVLFALNWKLSVIVVLTALVLLGVYAAFLPALHRRHRILTEAEQKMFAQQVETIYGIRTIKSLSLEGLKRYQRDLLVAKVVKAHQNFDHLANVPATIATPLERFIYSGSFFLGCYMALSDPLGMTAGRLIAFAMLCGRITAPIVQFASLLNGIEEARGALGEVASVMNVPPEEGRSGTGLKQPISGHVVFESVRFRYSPTASYALDGVSFQIPRGTVFGVMGRSGSGKTTVTRLLQGLNRDYEGLIKIDGMDLREIDLDHLRTHIGVVPQENFLFSGTVRDNISAARPKASFDKIVRAAQLAGAEEFIERLPRGYETAVEEGATNFSGGQRQRLAIARALLVDPPILILDEATSALDAESEAIVNASLMRIAQDRTVIIISHRLSSLAQSDAILVLERGRYYDLGKHEQLLARCDIYKSLWYQQNRHLALEDGNGRGEIHTPTST